jgi:hypothetical protein
VLGKTFLLSRGLHSELAPRAEELPCSTQPQTSPILLPSPDLSFPSHLLRPRPFLTPLSHPHLLNVVTFLGLLLPTLFHSMAPIREDTVTDLKDLVAKLETRVRQLEDRLGGDGTKSRTPSQSMRMILMGPPGAGKLGTPMSESHVLWLICFAGKGTQAPKIKDKYCVCHLVRKSTRRLAARFQLTSPRQPETCSARKSQRKPHLDEKQKRLWIKAGSSVMISWSI